LPQQRTILNSKALRDVLGQLREQYGYAGTPDLVFMLNEKKEKLFVFTKDLALLGTDGLRIDTMGMYVGAYYKGKMRLSIEGSQLFGPHCTKNVVEITHAQLQRWMRGEHLPLSEIPSAASADRDAFVIVRCGQDYAGSAKIHGDELRNYVPKTRYVHATYE
jgi:NOL1/NOP2/fmu family ribosome biogenesis protein